jgi:regulator of nonsense transcripts 2
MVANRLKYYVHTKASLPLDIEFTVQDIFAVTRPQWKFATSLDEATKAFQLAISQDQKSAGVDKYAEADDATSGASSEDENENGDGDEIEAYGDGDEDSASDEEDIEADGDDDSAAHDSDFNDESLVVTRQEEVVDPEDEADFERELAKMMAESLESRKFERKQLFDVPLPVRAKPREQAASADSANEAPPPGHTMAFSLLTKKGNRQQVSLSPVSMSVSRITLSC